MAQDAKTLSSSKCSRAALRHGVAHDRKEEPITAPVDLPAARKPYAVVVLDEGKLVEL